LDKTVIRQLPWILWTICIAILSLIPGDQLPTYHFDLISIDTLAHLIMYSALAFFHLIGIYSYLSDKKNKMNLSFFRMYSWVILIGIGFGLIIELIQGIYIYRRYFDFFDIVANFFGTIFGVFLFALIGIKLIKN